MSNSFKTFNSLIRSTAIRSSVDIPSVDIPSVNVPSVNVPSVNVPSVDAPSIGMYSIDVQSSGPGNLYAPGSDSPVGDQPSATTAPSTHAANAAEVDHEQISQLLVDVLEIQNYVSEKLAVDELRWHAEPEAERELLDEIFSRYGL